MKRFSIPLICTRRWSAGNTSQGSPPMHRIVASLLLLCASSFVALQSASAVTIDWSPVGNPGNAADTADGDSGTPGSRISAPCPTTTTSARTMSPTASMSSSSTPKTPLVQTRSVCGTAKWPTHVWRHQLQRRQRQRQQVRAHFGPPEPSGEFRHLVRHDSLRQLAEQRPGELAIRRRGPTRSSTRLPRLRPYPTAIASRGTRERPCFFPAKTSGTRRRTTTPARSSYYPVLRPAATRLRLRAARPALANHANYNSRRGQSDRRGRVHGNDEPLRRVRHGGQRLSMERSLDWRLVSGLAGRFVRTPPRPTCSPRSGIAANPAAESNIVGFRVASIRP